MAKFTYKHERGRELGKHGHRHIHGMDTDTGVDMDMDADLGVDDDIGRYSTLI
jgi:hypothetical protein